MPMIAEYYLRVVKKYKKTDFSRHVCVCTVVVLWS